MALLLVIILLPQILSLYYIDAMTQVAVYSIVALGLGVLVGRVGLISLGQAAILAIGAWVAARLLFATSLPYEVVLLAAGVITMALGTLVGLPALRMRGLYLALITLMLAGAITVVLASLNFPNGGHGFSGYNGALLHIPPIRRPGIATTDPAYFRYSVVAAAIMFLLVLVHVRTKPGRAWAAIRQSEPAALAAGINTTLYKLWAFALASFVTGVAGGRPGRRGPLPVLHRLPDPGLDHPAGGGPDGRRLQHLGRHRRRPAAPVAPGDPQRRRGLTGLAGDPVRHRRAPGAHHRPDRDRGPVAQGHRPAVQIRHRCEPALGGQSGVSPMIEVSGLTVRFGGVTSLDGMSVTFNAGTCGLIGPNGAGKTTFFNVLSGFLRPASGTVKAFDEDLLAMANFRRARWGVRRTFQTEQAIEDLSVYHNVAMIHEHSKLSGSDRQTDVLGAIELVGLESVAYAKVRTLGAGQRRLVEVARAIVGKPTAGAAR